MQHGPTSPTLAWQCGQCAARTASYRVGLGCSGRCAPACALALGPGLPSPFALRPCEGGVPELSGVFGGAVSCSRNAAFSLSSAVTRAVKASTCASSVEIRVSFSKDDSTVGSKDGATDRLTHVTRPGATQISP